MMEEEQRDVEEFEKILLWIARVSMSCIILMFSVFFIVLLIFCSSALEFHHIFLKELIAFPSSLLFYYFEYSRYLEIAAAIFVVTNGIAIVNNWWGIKENSDGEIRKLREENNNLSAKLFAETSSAEHYRWFVHETEEKCRKLEEEKNELVNELCAAKAASQLYRSYLHDLGS